MIESTESMLLNLSPNLVFSFNIFRVVIYFYFL